MKCEDEGKNSSGKIIFTDNSSQTDEELIYNYAWQSKLKLTSLFL